MLEAGAGGGGGCWEAPVGELDAGGGGGGGGGPPEEAAPDEGRAGAVVVESARRRLRPPRSSGSAEGPTAVLSPSSLPSSSLPPMDRPPGTLGGGAGCAGECGIAEERPRGVPTGMVDGS